MKIEIKIQDQKADIEIHQSDGTTRRFSIREEEQYIWKVTDKNREMTLIRIQGDLGMREVVIRALKEILKK